MARKKPPVPPLPNAAEASALVPISTGADPPGYAALLDDLKARIRTTQIKASLAVNRELTLLYWHIGKAIVERQQREGWGKSVIDRLARDVRAAFPGLSGFSPGNVWRMRAFYLAYSQEVAILAQAARELGDGPPSGVAALPWGHNIVLLEKVKEAEQRLWYARMTVEHGWSRAVLAYHIDTGAYGCKGQAITNFQRTLAAPQSDLAQELLKDPYHFEFLTLTEDAHELSLQRGLVEHLRDFLTELGVGFAYVGSRYHLVVGGKDYYLDLLFYHLRLRCFVVIELKVREFEPEHSGKLNFYLSAVDDLLRHPGDQPTIGLILCPNKNRVTVEYSLRDRGKPMGVAGYQVRQPLPEALRDSLPSVERIEAELAKVREQRDTEEAT
jgi:predicted nuclease of restriction endonuclease-like (RecB) superfamily